MEPAVGSLIPPLCVQAEEPAWVALGQRHRSPRAPPEDGNNKPLLFSRDVVLLRRDVVALWAKRPKPVLQGQKTSSRKIESTQWSELPSLVLAPANLAV